MNFFSLEFSKHLFTSSESPNTFVLCTRTILKLTQKIWLFPQTLMILNQSEIRIKLFEPNNSNLTIQSYIQLATKMLT